MSNKRMNHVFNEMVVKAGRDIDTAELQFINGGVSATFFCTQQAIHAAHAINNHDRMVEENKKLLIALCDIQGMCIGEIAMGYKLDPESIGMMIYEATGMTHPELSAKLNQEGEG